MQRPLLKQLASLAVIALACAGQPGCLLNDRRTEDPTEAASCERNSDCEEPGFECPPCTKTCGRFGLILCSDADGDGYGIGECRAECEYPEVDPDDNDWSVNPGAAEVCDGKDNDADGQTDEPFDCSERGDLDCVTNLGTPREDAFFRCLEGACVLVPAKVDGDCVGVTLSCVDGRYDDAEAIARGCLP